MNENFTANKKSAQGSAKRRPGARLLLTFVVMY